MLRIALVDDHVLLRRGLAELVSKLGYQVLSEYNNGKELCDQLKEDNIPDLVLLDIKMPQMDGYETALWLKKYYPDIKVLALSQYDDESIVIRMLKNGARGYLLKDCEPAELKLAIETVFHNGFYYSEMVSSRLVHNLGTDNDEHGTNRLLHLSEREIEFLKLACTEMTYKEIADKMHISPRTIDGYRDDLFQKLDLKTRTGLIIYSIKHHIVEL